MNEEEWAEKQGKLREEIIELEEEIAEIEKGKKNVPEKKHLEKCQILKEKHDEFRDLINKDPYMFRVKD